MEETDEAPPVQSAVETPHLRLKCILETSPNIAMLLISWGWIFFAGSAPDTVGKSFAWILPITIAAIYSIIYLIVHYCTVYTELGEGGSPKPEKLGTFAKTSYQQAVVNTLRSAACAGVIATVLTLWLFDAGKAFIGDLPPLNESRSMAQWIGFFILFVILCCFWAVFMVLTWAVTVRDLLVLGEQPGSEGKLGRGG